MRSPRVEIEDNPEENTEQPRNPVSVHRGGVPMMPKFNPADVKLKPTGSGYAYDFDFI